MRILWFWIKLLPDLPWIYFSAKKALRLPYEERYAKLRKVASLIVKKLNVQIEVIGKENIPLQEGFMFAANHQGSADAFIFVDSCAITTTAVSKIEGKQIPFLSMWYDVMEVIFFKRESLKDGVRMANSLASYLLQGRNVLIFPEGTRSRSQIMNDFKPGSFKGAYKAKAPIIPLALINAYIPLDSKAKKKPVKVVYGQPLHYEEYGQWSTMQLASEVKERIQSMIDQYQ